MIVRRKGRRRNLASVIIYEKNLVLINQKWLLTIKTTSGIIIIQNLIINNQRR